MHIEQWWPKLKSSTREWLIAHNGDVVSADIAAEIRDAGGSVAEDAGQGGGSGAYLTDEATDWIETVANDETPGSP